MSLVATCCVCDALLRTYNGDTRCERCNQDCPTCGGDVAFCRHALPEQLTERRPDPLKHCEPRIDPLLKAKRRRAA